MRLMRASNVRLCFSKDSRRSEVEDGMDYMTQPPVTRTHVHVHAHTHTHPCTMSGLDLSQQLITECKRSRAANAFYKYNDALVRQLCREIRALDPHLVAFYDSIRDVDLDVNPVDPARLSAITMVQAMIERDKRCLLAYHNFRVDLLKGLYWSNGGALPLILNDAEIRSKLAPHEVDFLREYSKSIGEWRSEVLDVVDLAMGVDRPPKDINVAVVVTRECGLVSTESGEIDFRKGHRYLVRKSEVEHLILQGYLTEV